MTILRGAIWIEHERGGALDVAINLGRLASVPVRLGAVADAGRLLGGSDALTEDLGVGTASWAARRNDETRELLRAQLGDEPLMELPRRGTCADGRRRCRARARFQVRGSEPLGDVLAAPTANPSAP